MAGGDHIQIHLAELSVGLDKITNLEQEGYISNLEGCVKYHPHH